MTSAAALSDLGDTLSAALGRRGRRWRSDEERENWTRRVWGRLHAALHGVESLDTPEASLIVQETVGDALHDAMRSGAIVRARRASVAVRERSPETAG